MDAYDIAGAAADFGALIGRVEAGEQVSIVRDGRIVARVVPAAAIDSDFVDRLRELTDSLPMQPVDAVTTVRALRGEARY